MIQKLAGAEVPPPCGALWHPVAAVNPCIASQQSPGGCCEAIYKLLQEILMVLEASGGCCESIIDGLESPGGCSEAMHTLLQ